MLNVLMDIEDEEEKSMREQIKDNPPKEKPIHSRFGTECLVDKLQQDIIFCSTCHEFNLEPISIPCGHIFCKSCLKQQSITDTRCPICKNPFNFDGIQVSAQLKAMIKNTKVKCCNSACDTLIAIEKLKSHIETECAYEPAICEFCKQEVIRMKLEEHEEACKNEKLKCKGCLQKVERPKLYDHYLLCKEITVKCKYHKELGCPIALKRKMMTMHEEDKAYHFDMAMKMTSKKKGVVKTDSSKKDLIGMAISVLDISRCKIKRDDDDSDDDDGHLIEDHLSDGVWEPAIILNVSQDGIFVKYIRWSSNYNEWINLPSCAYRISEFNVNLYKGESTRVYGTKKEYILVKEQYGIFN